MDGWVGRWRQNCFKDCLQQSKTLLILTERKGNKKSLNLRDVIYGCSLISGTWKNRISWLWHVLYLAGLFTHLLNIFLTSQNPNIFQFWNLDFNNRPSEDWKSLQKSFGTQFLSAVKMQNFILFQKKYFFKLENAKMFQFSFLIICKALYR